jgi:hypothetical protein
LRQHVRNHQQLAAGELAKQTQVVAIGQRRMLVGRGEAQRRPVDRNGDPAGIGSEHGGLHEEQRSALGSQLISGPERGESAVELLAERSGKQARGSRLLEARRAGRAHGLDLLSGAEPQVLGRGGVLYEQARAGELTVRQRRVTHDDGQVIGAARPAGVGWQHVAQGVNGASFVTHVAGDARIARACDHGLTGETVEPQIADREILPSSHTELGAAQLGAPAQ